MDWGRTLEQLAKLEWDDAPKEWQMLYVSSRTEYQVGNGGIEKAFTDLSDAEFPLWLESLKAMGLLVLVEVVEQAQHLLSPSEVPVSQDARQALIAERYDAIEEELGGLSERYWGESDTVALAVSKFILANPDVFRLPG